MNTNTQAQAQVTIDNRFNVLRKLGSGATSNVYEALDMTTDTKVAVKVYKTNDPTQLPYEQ